METLYLIMGFALGLVCGLILNQGKQTAKIHDSDIVDVSNLKEDDKASIKHQVTWFEDSYDEE